MHNIYGIYKERLLSPLGIWLWSGEARRLWTGAQERRIPMGKIAWILTKRIYRRPKKLTTLSKNRLKSREFLSFPCVKCVKGNYFCWVDMQMKKLQFWLLSQSYQQFVNYSFNCDHLNCSDRWALRMTNYFVKPPPGCVSVYLSGKKLPTFLYIR